MTTDRHDDELRRQAEDTTRDHLRSLREIPRLIDDLWSSSAPAAAHDRALLGGIGRRRFFKVGGLTVMSAAVLAACGNDSSDTGSGATTTTRATTTTMGGSSSTAMAGAADATDVLILKTASSLERLAVAVYDTAIANASKLGISAGVGEVATLFKMQHTDHAGVFEKATQDAGSTPFTKPNPAVLAAIQPKIDALKTEQDVLELAYSLEVAAAETYQSTIGVFANAAYNPVAASVGGVEARHVAILGHALDATFARSITNGLTVGFQKTDQAVKAGTGVS